MNNGAAIGYMMIAAKTWLRLDRELVRELEGAMREAMDEYTEEEAEQFYQSN